MWAQVSSWVRQYRTGVLVGFLVLGCVGLANLRARDPAARVLWQPPRLVASGAPAPKWDKSKDLKVGAAVPRIGLTDVRGPENVAITLPDGLSSLAGERPLLLVFATSCAGCGENAAAAWERFATANRDVALVLATADSVDNIRQAQARHKSPLRLLRDGGAKGAKGFRAQFLPRAYLIDSSGRALWLQRTPGASVRQLTSGVREALRNSRRPTGRAGGEG